MAYPYSQLAAQHHHQRNSSDAEKLIDEALDMMLQFHEPIRQSAAHIYVSAISFTSQSTLLSATFAMKLEDIPRLISDANKSARLVVIRPPLLDGRAIAAISPDAKQFAYAQDDEMRIWDAMECTPIDAKLTGHTAAIFWIKYSHDGTRIFSRDKSGGARVWNATTQKCILEFDSGVRSMAFVADKIVVRYDTYTVVHDIVDCALATNLPEMIAHPNRRDPYSKSSHPKMIDLMTGSDITVKFEHGLIRDIACPPDCCKLACSYYYRTDWTREWSIRVFDTFTGDRIGDPIGPIISVWIPEMCFAADGRRLLVCSSTDFEISCISIYDADSGRLLAGPFQGHKLNPSPSSHSCSLNESRFLYGWSDGFQIVHSQTGEVIIAAKGDVMGDTVMSYDGSRVVSLDPGSITVWDIAVLAGHLPEDRHVASAMLSPNGKHLLLALSDGTLKLDDVSVYPTSSILLKGVRLRWPFLLMDLSLFPRTMTTLYVFGIPTWRLLCRSCYTDIVDPSPLSRSRRIPAFSLHPQI